MTRKHLNKLLAILELIRYRSAILIILTSFICLWVLNFKMPLTQYFLALGALLCIFSGAFALNDYLDFPLDTINAPWRPLPSQKVKRDTAIKITIVAFTLGLAFSFFINFACLILSIVMISLSIFYSIIFKKFGILGNIIWAFTASGIFIYFGLGVNQISIFKYLILFSFLSILSREILTDIRDFKGDKANGRYTLPVLFGQRIGLSIALFIFSVYTFLSFIPYLNGTYNVFYLLLNSIILPGIIFFMFIHLMFHFSRRNLLSLISLFTKIIHIGLFSFIIGTM